MRELQPALCQSYNIDSNIQLVYWNQYDDGLCKPKHVGANIIVLNVLTV